MHKTVNQSILGCTILQISVILAKEKLCLDKFHVDRNKEDDFRR